MRIGDAAKRLGLEVDTVRRLANEGHIEFESTPGGHRRFTEAGLAAYQRRKRHPAKGPDPRPAAPSQSMTVRAPVAPVRRQEPDLEIWEPDIEDDVEQEFPGPSLSAPPRPFRPGPAPHDHAAELKRLTAIKQSALGSIPWDVPDNWRARVIADLEEFVSTRQFPAHLGPWKTSRIARGRIEEVVAPFRAQQAAEKARKVADQKAESRIVELRRHGANYALRETMTWAWSEQWAARQAATKELDVKVRADMSERDVERMVDDVLSDWEEEEGDRE